MTSNFQEMGSPGAYAAAIVYPNVVTLGSLNGTANLLEWKAYFVERLILNETNKKAVLGYKNFKGNDSDRMGVPL